MSMSLPLVKVGDTMAILVDIVIRNGVEADLTAEECDAPRVFYLTDTKEFVVSRGDGTHENITREIKEHGNILSAVQDTLGTTATVQFVNEQIAKAQLEGAGVDTSNFVMQSQLINYIKSSDLAQSVGFSTVVPVSQAAMTRELDSIRIPGGGLVETSSNIFNPALIQLDQIVDYSGNIVASENGDAMSQLFTVKDGETAITCSYVTGSGVHQLQSFVVTFFDKYMKMVQQMSGTSHTIPSNAKYFILNFGNIFINVADRMMVQWGTEMTTFEPYSEPVIQGRPVVRNENLELVDIVESSNKYNYKTRTDDVSMNTDGSTMSNTLRSVSDYIYCYGESVFSVSAGAEGVFCFYDESKTFLPPYGVYSSSGKSNIAIPSGAHYIRTSLLKNHSRIFTLAFSNTPIGYERYGKITESIKSDFDRNSCKSILSEALVKGWQIKLLGDSITHGVCGSNFAQDGTIIPDDGTEFRVNTSGYCWANLFKNYINDKYGNTVLNYGTRGIRSYDILRRLEADNGYVTNEDKLLIVMIGTNNKWALENSTLNDLKDDIQWIVDWCLEHNKKLILISAPASSVDYDTHYEDQVPVKFHNEDIDHIFKEVAYKNNMDYIPMYQRMVEYCDLKGISIDSILADGLHPNDEGYYIIYKILMKELGLAYQMPGSTWDVAPAAN